MMHRRYDTSLFADKIELIRRVMPQAFIGVDVIVGFRGETPERFEDSFKFLESLDISQMHVFSYSERSGTQALKIEYVVSPEDKKMRHKRLQNLSDEKWKTFYNRQVGSVVKVLFENVRSGGKMHGFSENYIRVEVPYSKDLVNQTFSLRLGKFNMDETALEAEIV